MKIPRIYTGADNQSHIEDKEFPVELKGRVGLHSESIKITGISFIESLDDFNYSWHTAPCRQFVIAMEGKCEIEISDGTKRMFTPGDILLAEDTTGRGHISRHFSPAQGKPWRIAFLPLG